MDIGIIKSIETMRDTLLKHYDLPLEERQKAEALFYRMEQFGAGCRNRADFEKKFVSQTMSHEYYGLIVEFSAYVKEPVPHGTQAGKEMEFAIKTMRQQPVMRNPAEEAIRYAVLGYPATGRRKGNRIRNILHKLFCRKSDPDTLVI